MNAKQALVILIAGTAAIRLLCAVSLGLGNDEAYHSLYAAHPALSYFDHPPMMAWVELAGLAVSRGVTAPWALRIGFIVLFAGSTWILARMTSRYYGAKAGFLAALALNLTGYYGLAASMFALPDGPLLFFWLLTLDRLSLALEEPDSGRLRYWIEAGLAWGGAMLSKYHAIFIPMGVVSLLLLDARRRRRLLQPGPYLALAIGVAVFSPVLIWNARHGWVSFLFQGGRAVGELGVPRPDYLAATVLAQAGYLFPWIWIPLVTVLVRGWCGWSSESSGPERLWLCVATVPLAAFNAVACFPARPAPLGVDRPGVPFPDAGPGVGRSDRGASRSRPSPPGRLCRPFPDAGDPRGRPGTWDPASSSEAGTTPVNVLDTRTDPTLDLYGWDQVAGRIRQLGLIEDPGSFVFTRYWYQSAQVAYALGGDRTVLCYNSDDPRGFAFWSRPEDWLGRDGVLVLVGTEPDVIARYFGRYFAKVEPASEFWVERNGKPVRRIRLYRCIRQRIAYPFAMDRESQLARHNAHAGQSERTTR